MKKSDQERFRDTVYVVGTGFSAGLGYPLSKKQLEEPVTGGGTKPEGQT